METIKICPNCRKPLPPDVPLGLCPECLIKSGFPTGAEPGDAGETAGARFVPPPVAEIAQLFPQLEILRLIGQGGMGAVYKARQPSLDRFVALKVLPPAVGSDPGFAERFNREARALARLNHPNIVAVHDFGKAGPLHYLLMEFVDGTNLREVEQAGKLTPEQALAIVPQICEGLQFAHNEGIVHRDIKPENLLLDKKGRVKITDFGIAKMVGIGGGQQTLTGAKDVVGTPHYMAPEQIEHPLAVDHRADIYSLGVVFYEMLTGELPLGKFQPPSKKVHVDVRLDEVVLHTLEKEPERRYQHASQVKTDVETISVMGHGASAPNQNESVPTAAQMESARNHLKIPARGLIASVVLQLLFALGLLIFAIPGVFRESGNLVGCAVIGLTVVGFLIPTAVVLAGAINMSNLRRHTFTIVASVVAAVAGPGAILGLPFGVWALVILTRREVRQAFEANRPVTGPTAIPDSRKMDSARAQVKGPAIGLVVAGVLDWALCASFCIIAGFSARSTDLISIESASGVLVWLPILVMALSSCIIYAGLKFMQLERRGWVMLGSVLAMLVSPGNLAGLPLGIWALVVLNRPEIKEAFAANRSRSNHRNVRAGAGGPSHFSVPAIVGAAWMPLFLASLLTITFGQEQFPQSYGEIPRALLFLGLAAPVATTILGWLAVMQIRHSSGSFRGLELAVFDGLLFPLLGLDLWIGILFLAAAKTLAHWRGLNGSLFLNLWEFAFWTFLLFVVCAAFDFLVARLIWRQANRPREGLNSSPKLHWNKIVSHVLGLGVLALGLVSFSTASWVLCARSVDNVNQPFVNDPQVIGHWSSVDFVESPDDFKPGKPAWKGDLSVFRNFTVYPDGRTSYRWLTWTKGVFINKGEKTAASYETRNFDGTNYLFVQWKNGDYILFHSNPSYFVLRQEVNTNFYIGQTWFPQGDSIEITSVERTKNQMTVKGHYNLVSHDQAELALYVTVTNKAFPGGTGEERPISKGRGDFTLVHLPPILGLPHVSMYGADGHCFASLYFGTKTEALEERQASWITNTPSAAGASNTEPEDLREARARLAELRVSYGEKNASVQEALARVKELERISRDEPNMPADLREAKAQLAELQVIYGKQNPAVQKALARIKELERITKEEPNAPADLRKAKAHLAELRVSFSERSPQIQEALARIKMLEQNNIATNVEANSAAADQPPAVLKTFPQVGATGVDPAIKEITVTFDRDMDDGFSWTGGGPDFPPSPEGQGAHWRDKRTCVLPVKLQAGHFYRVGINSKSFQNFRSADGMPATPSAIYFATQGASEQVKAMAAKPKIVSLVPANGAQDADPNLTEIRVTFNVPMAGGFSWTSDDSEFPPGREGKHCHWTEDHKTCVLPVQLQPDRAYHLGLNGSPFSNFQSAGGVPLAPVDYRFKTRAN
jgi:predicted Ser/Thr protein kinase